MESEHLQGFGLFLERERTRQGLSLDDLSGRTKITLRMLNALEDEDWDTLPADVYVRGFIKSVASALSLEPSEPLKLFDEARKHRPNSAPRLPAASPAPAASGSLDRYDEAQALVTPESAVAAWLAAARRKGTSPPAPAERKVSAVDKNKKKMSGVGRGPRKVSLAVILILVIVALTLVVSYMVNRQGSTENQSKKPAANETVNFDLTG